MFRGGERDLRKLGRDVEREAQVFGSARTVLARTGGAVLVAVLMLSSRLGALGLVRVLERERERLHRIAGACSPSGRQRLRLVLVFLAVVLLRMKERGDHETENRHRGEKQRSV